MKVSEKEFSLPFIIENNLELDFHLEGLEEIVNNLKKNGYELEANFSDIKNDSLSLDGLLGVDALKFLGSMQLINCMRGNAFALLKGIDLFGNISDFLVSGSYSKSEVCQLNYNK